MQQVLTANRLGPGEVVYWNAVRGWVSRFDDAEILEGEEASAALEAAGQSVLRREVVNPYLFAVRIEEGRPIPIKAREIIRAAGPTVRRDLGKQAYGA